MKQVLLTKQQHSMVQKALTWMISDLQYERHQARQHGCMTDSYDKEIEQYKELKSQLSDENIQG